MRKLLTKHWPLVGIGVILTTVLAYLLAARVGPVANPISAVINPEESLKLQNIHFAQTTTDKRLKWILDASEVRISLLCICEPVKAS